MSDRITAFKRTGTLRGCTETLLLSLVLMVGLLLVRDQIPDNALQLGMLYIGGFSALWFTLRLRIIERSFWGRVITECLNSAALGFSIILPLPLLSQLIVRWLPVQIENVAAKAYFPLFVSAPVFLGLRTLLYVWRWWNDFRKQKLVWTLVHTQLSLVFTIALIVSLIGAAGITIDASRNFPEETLVATIAHRIVLTILPFLGISVVGMGVSLMVIMPPAALASYLFSRRITQRLEDLASSTRALRQGEFNRRVNVEGVDEVAQLGQDFNTMADHLETALGEIQDERDKVAAMLENHRQLTANVSHELRTPLATVRGTLEPTLEKKEIPSPESLAVIYREVEKLERLIDDLFTLSRAEMNTLTLDVHSTDLAPIVERLVGTYASLVWERDRVEVVFQSAGENPTALVDSGRLEQILSNLLRNAVRHTPPGGIVAVVMSKLEDYVQIEVRDTGEGIQSDDLPLIWERFYRGSKDVKTTGAGLGLALVKELTESMGGSVGVESVVGEGSVFWIRVPAACR